MVLLAWGMRKALRSMGESAGHMVKLGDGAFHLADEDVGFHPVGMGLSHPLRLTMARARKGLGQVSIMPRHGTRAAWVD
ncbi:hypothetical protein L484_002992 [Morus notabilis]|uniref:Uncharacterized protein n=1 Tax=Morus notabilis TaxID=981085 RepID=W9S8H7_9ROSA|nr:hypothetical protein L484_002992 [Morus notabilis]